MTGQTAEKDGKKLTGPLLLLALVPLMVGAALNWWPSLGSSLWRSPEVEACENYVLSGLRSPTTYKLIKADSTPVQGELWVSLVYDAANAYGTPIRETELCRFRITGGKAVVPYVPDPDDSLTVSLRRLDELTGRERKPCCLD